jgi:hypothetical protein
MSILDKIKGILAPERSLNAAQKLWERLGLPTALGKHRNGGYVGTAKPRKFRQGEPRVRLARDWDDDQHTGALRLAALKYDGAIKPKPANGVRESRRELERRLNWLRERVAAEAAS